MNAAPVAQTKDTPTTSQNPISLSEKGTGTFIPHKLKMMVGTARIIVIDAKNFITIFRLFEITDAYASIVPLKILL